MAKLKSGKYEKKIVKSFQMPTTKKYRSAPLEPIFNFKERLEKKRTVKIAQVTLLQFSRI